MHIITNCDTINNLWDKDITKDNDSLSVFFSIELS